MKKSLLLLIWLMCGGSAVVWAQVATIGVRQFAGAAAVGDFGPLNSGIQAQSGNRHAYVYTANMIAGNAVPNQNAAVTPISDGDTIRALDFWKSTNAALTGTNNVRIFLKNVPYNTFGTAPINWTDSVTTATLVYEGSANAVMTANSGFKRFNFDTPYAYTTASGTSLAIFIEYQQQTALPARIVFLGGGPAPGAPTYTPGQVHWVNDTTGTLPDLTNFTPANGMRPQIRIVYPFEDDASPIAVYTANRLPLPVGFPHTVSAAVQNIGRLSKSDFGVSLRVTGPGNALVFEDSVTITNTLTPDQIVNVTFGSFTPPAPGSYNISVITADDDGNANNTLTYTQEVNTQGLYRYATPAAAIGAFRNTTIITAVRYTASSPVQVNTISMPIFSNAANSALGGLLQAHVLNSNGEIIGSSDTLTVTAATVGPVYTDFPIVNFPDSATAAVVSGDFYVGFSMAIGTATGFFPYSHQDEIPPRPGLYFAIPIDGGTPVAVAAPFGRLMIQAQVSEVTARLQVLHNAPQPGFDTVDVYVNGGLFIDDFVFRTGTPFVDVPAGVELEIGIAPGNSTGPDDALFIFEGIELEADETYILVASQDPDAADEVTLLAYTPALETSGNPTLTAVLVHHGSPDAPPVKVFETGINNNVEIVSLFSFTDFDNYLEISAIDGYVLEVRTADDSVVASYDADLAAANLGGAAITILASGYLAPDSTEPAFGLFVAVPDGGPFVELPETTTRLQDNALARAVRLYPNPTTGHVTLSCQELGADRLAIEVVDAQGRVVQREDLRPTSASFNHEVRLHVAAGVYFIRLSTDQHVHTRRLMVR